MEQEQKYKIIFVSEDKVEYYGEPGTNTMHAVYLEEYIKKYFKDHPILSRLTFSTGANSLAYALTYFEQMAIVLNETRIGANGKPKYGTNVCLIFPNKISEKLEEQLLSISDSLGGFSNFYVEKTVVVDNCLEGEFIPIDNDLSINELLLEVIKNINGVEELTRK